MTKPKKKKGEDPKRKKDLKDEELEGVAGGLLSRTLVSFDPQPEPPGIVQLPQVTIIKK